MAAREPAFFKFISSQGFSDRIKIAPGYVNYKQGKLPSRVILKDQYGNHWHVQVEKHQNKFFFTEGWKKFVNENHVEVGDFIVFYYDRLNVFHIVLLGHDSCEKEGVGGPKTKVLGGEEKEDTLKDSQGEPTDEDEVEFCVHEEDNTEINILDINDEATDVFKKEIQNPMSGASGKGLIIKEEIQSEDGRATAAEAQHGNEINIVDMDVDEDEVQNSNSGASGK